MFLGSHVIGGIFYAKFGIRTFHCLRFYSDGLVLDATVQVKQGDAIEEWENVQKWFHREEADFTYLSSGEWSLEGNQLYFWTLWYRGAVVYHGTYFGDQIDLATHSYIN